MLVDIEQLLQTLKAIGASPSDGGEEYGVAAATRKKNTPSSQPRTPEHRKDTASDKEVILKKYRRRKRVDRTNVLRQIE